MPTRVTNRFLHKRCVTKTNRRHGLRSRFIGEVEEKAKTRHRFEFLFGEHSLHTGVIGSIPIAPTTHSASAALGNLKQNEREDGTSTRGESVDFVHAAFRDRELALGHATVRQ